MPIAEAYRDDLADIHDPVRSRGVLFDLFETLVTERHAPPARASSLGPRLGIDAGVFRGAWKAQRGRVTRGQLTFADALREIGEALGRRLDADLVLALSNERRVQKAAVFQRFDPVALGVLRQLRDRGCSLAVVSNGFAEDVEAWPRCRAAECFDTSVFSFEVGAAKPEPHIYLEAMQRLGVEAPNALFVGDGGDDELLGAERAGLRAAQATWFRGELAGLPRHIPRLSSWSQVLELATAG
jgi:putative hydrolase of the HAD superfamily